MKKILFHIDTLDGGGAEKALCALVNNMDLSKYDITVQTLFPCEYDKYLRPEIKYRYCYKYRWYQLYRLEAATGLVYPLHMKDKYDIEVAYLECGPTKVIAQSTNKKAKKIAYVHCDLKKAFDINFAKKTEKYYKRFDMIACVSERCKESFDALYGNNYNTKVIHNVIECEKILKKADAKIDVDKKGFTICTVGRLTRPKNYLRLLRTHKRLIEEGLFHYLWIIGEGEDRAILEEYIDKYKLYETITLFGFQSNPYPYMKIADLLVCSSIYEGYSTFVTECVILQKPIITTDCAGMQEILDGYPLGKIVTNEDTAFFDSVKEYLLNNSEDRRQETEDTHPQISTKALVRQNERAFELI